MRAVPARAAGGVPVMDFKLHCLINTCLRTSSSEDPEEAPQVAGEGAADGHGIIGEGEHFVWSDVDVQPTAPLWRLHAALLALLAPEGPGDGYDPRERADIWTQRE
jgi:hypothetical protein